MLRRIPLFVLAFKAEDEAGAGGTATVTPPKLEEPAERTVPVQEVQKERQRRQEAESKLARLEAEAETRRQQELGETDRLKEQLAAAETRATEAERKAQNADRRIWAVDAAVAAGFEKPSGAVKLIDNLDAIESAEDAKEAVKQVARDYPGLIRATKEPGGDLKQVLRDGKRPEDNDEPDDKLLTKEQLDGLSQAEVRQLEKDKPGLLDRSLAALNTT